jgi:hypothetical protein
MATVLYYPYPPGGTHDVVHKAVIRGAHDLHQVVQNVIDDLTANGYLPPGSKPLEAEQKPVKKITRSESLPAAVVAAGE